MSKLVNHGACGKTWKQKGERSGHCGSCHETFYGSSAFDRHQKDGMCLDPAVSGDSWWQDDDMQWHYGPRLTDDQKRERGWM